MLKFAVCDDEPWMAQAIAEQISGYMDGMGKAAYSVSRFSDGRALLKDGGGFDVFFLDIQMERPDGMETAAELRRRGERGLIIFITVLKESVFDAFSVEAYDYLVKPLDIARFARTMERALKTLEQRCAQTMAVRRGAVCEVIPLADVVYCEVLGRKVYLHKSDGTVMDYYDRLENLERRVDGRFFRCHRSYLVNLDYVRGLRDGRITALQGETIPVSRLRERELTQALLRRMKEGTA